MKKAAFSWHRELSTTDYRAASFEKARRLDPKSVMVIIVLGQDRAEMKDLAGARKYYEEALKLEANGQYAPTAKEALRKLKKN